MTKTADTPLTRRLIMAILALGLFATVSLSAHPAQAATTEVSASQVPAASCTLYGKVNGRVQIAGPENWIASYQYGLTKYNFSTRTWDVVLETGWQNGFNLGSDGVVDFTIKINRDLGYYRFFVKTAVSANGNSWHIDSHWTEANLYNTHVNGTQNRSWCYLP